MSLSDLDQNRSMINIVDIVGMELLNDTVISEMCKALSKSINHITISQVEMSPFNHKFMDGKRNKIFRLINSLPDSSHIVIGDSEFAGLNDGDIDLGHISFKNIKLLKRPRCSFRGRTELEIENIGRQRLMDFPNVMIENIDLAGGNMSAFYA
jgi:hypothetical protein